jgi:citrate lyase subunit beta/citryl-CoA lyase
MGGVDLRRDLNAGDGDLPMLYARSQIVAASVAAGLAPPIDSVYANVADTDGLRAQAEHARSLGFAGKSAIHPRQIPVLHEVFTPDDDEVAWARAVIDAFTAAGGQPLRLEGGEFVDAPVADRARRVLALAAASDPDRSR